MWPIVADGENTEAAMLPVRIRTHVRVTVILHQVGLHFTGSYNTACVQIGGMYIMYRPLAIAVCLYVCG